MTKKLEQNGWDRLVLEKIKKLSLFDNSEMLSYYILFKKNKKTKEEILALYRLHLYGAIKISNFSHTPSPTNFIYQEGKEEKLTQKYLFIFRKLPKFDELFNYYNEEKNEASDVLVCKKLQFNLNTGDAIYNKTKTNFKPDTDEYKILKALMEKENQRLSYDKINKALDKDSNSKIDRRNISFIIRNIKNKLEIVGKKKKPKNKDLFKPCNGYKIIC